MITNDDIDDIEEVLNTVDPGLADDGSDPGENEGDFFNPTEIEFLYESNNLPALPPGVIYGVKNGWGGMEPYIYSYAVIPCETDRRKRERAYTEQYWFSWVGTAGFGPLASYRFAVPGTHRAWVSK